MPPPDRIAALLARDIARITQALIDGGSVAQWERAMTDAITRGHAAAGITGASEQILRAQGRAALEAWAKDRLLSEGTRRIVKEAVAGQLPYLRQFAADVRAGQLSDAQIAARAALYAGATRSTWSKGRWEGKGLPAHPADGGTTCLVSCKCRWAERGDGMHWELAAAEHCDDCEGRAARWRPWRGE